MKNSDAPLRGGRGIIISVVAMLCLAAMDATGKMLVQSYPIVQIMAVRFAVFFGVVLLVTACSRTRVLARSKVPAIQLVRSLLLVLEVTVFMLAFSVMPLGDVHAIAAVAPLIALILAAWCLGETVEKSGWLAIVAGFTGVLVIIRPGAGVMSAYALVALAGAFLWAAYQVLSRRVAQYDVPAITVRYTACVGFLVFGCLAPFYWIAPPLADWQWLVLNGIFGAMGHYLLIKALALAPASTLQPFGYTLVLWAMIIGFFVFGDLPDAFTLLGAMIVLGAGLYAAKADGALRALAMLVRRPVRK